MVETGREHPAPVGLQESSVDPSLAQRADPANSQLFQVPIFPVSQDMQSGIRAQEIFNTGIECIIDLANPMIDMITLSNYIKKEPNNEIRGRSYFPDYKLNPAIRRRK